MGMDIREFWEVTPYEFMIKIEAYSERLESEVKLSVQTAWLTVAFDRTKRLPKIDTLFKQTEGKKQMTDEQMLESVKRLNSIFGGAKNGGI